MRLDFQNRIRTLFPAYFALVMATGIVAIASMRVGIKGVAVFLLAVATFAYIVLFVMTLIRVVGYKAELIADFKNAAKAPGYFTMVAATNVLGTGLFRIEGLPQVAWGLWIFALVLYTFLIHAFLVNFMTAKMEGSLVSSLNGGWLIMVVGLQSIASLGAMLTETLGNPGPLMAINVGAFLLAGGMYLLLISALTMRLILLPLEPEQLVPTYWIMMGAAAISTLAGAEICGHWTAWTFGINLLPFMQGLSCLFWVVATSWIPLLILLGIWRHIIRRFSFRYDPLFWSIVFPLGMFTSATHAMIKTFAIHELQRLPLLLFPIPLISWGLVTFGMVRQGLAQLQTEKSPN